MIVRKLGLYGLAFGIFLIVAGVRFWVIDRYSVNVPTNDALIKECQRLEAAILNGEPWLGNFLKPHNEHRLYVSLGVSAGLTLLGRQWDNRMQSGVGGLVCAATLAGLFLIACRHLPKSRWALAAAIMLAVGASLMAWENIVSGFQTSFYFLILFSCVAIYAACQDRAGIGLRCAGAVSGLLAVFTMGSGFLWTVPAIVGNGVVSSGQRKGSATPRVVAVLFPLAILCAGLFLMYSPPWHEVLRAKTIGGFAAYFIRCLAWPTPHHETLLLFWHGPLVVFIIVSLASRTYRQGPIFFVLLYAWCIMNIGGLAYGRGSGGGFPAPRYCDVIAIAMICQAILFLYTVEIAPLPRRLRLVGRVCLAAWLLCLGIALYHVSKESVVDLDRQRSSLEEIAGNIRQFNESGDVEKLHAGPLPLPLSLKDMVVPALSSPGMQAIMPATLRKPVALQFPDGGEGALAGGRQGKNGGAVLQTSAVEKGDVVDTISTPVALSDYRYWQIEFEGRFNQGEVSMYFRDPSKGKDVYRQMLPSPREGATRSTRIHVPTGNHAVGVSIGGMGNWIRIDRIAEVSSISYWSDYVLRRGLIVAGVGIVMVVVFLVTLLQGEASRGENGETDASKC